MAEEVCAGDGVQHLEILDLLAQLVDKSMALVDARDTEARYRLLEPIRQYAAERLEASGEATTYRGRQSTALLQFTLANEVGRAGPDEISSLDRLEVEHDNIRAALRWALTHAGGRAALRCSAVVPASSSSRSTRRSWSAARSSAGRVARR